MLIVCSGVRVAASNFPREDNYVAFSSAGLYTYKQVQAGRFANRKEMRVCILYV